VAGERVRQRKKKLTLSLAQTSDLATDEAISAWLDALGVPSADDPATPDDGESAAGTDERTNEEEPPR
jgi:hypothetical protein